MEASWSLSIPKVSVHQVLMFAQLIALICYCLTLSAVIIYFSIIRKKVTAQEQTTIAKNLETAIETTTGWGAGICTLTLVVYIVLWFFGSAATQRISEEWFENMIILWIGSGALSFFLTIFLGMAMKSVKECAQFCKKARGLPVRLLMLGFLTLGMVAFLKY